MTSEFSLSASAGGDPDTYTASPYPAPRTSILNPSPRTIV
jgi:hypothetical protein